MSQITLPSDMTLDEYLTLYLMQFGAAQLMEGLAPGEALFLDLGVERFGCAHRAILIDRLCELWRNHVQSNPADNGNGAAEPDLPA